LFIDKRRWFFHKSQSQLKKTLKNEKKREFCRYRCSLFVFLLKKNVWYIVYFSQLLMFFEGDNEGFRNVSHIDKTPSKKTAIGKTLLFVTFCVMVWALCRRDSFKVVFLRGVV